MWRNAVLAMVVLVTVAGTVRAEDDVEARLNTVRSQLLSMGHGYYPQSEWDDLLGELDALGTQAEAAGDPASVVEVRVLQALVYSDIRKEYDTARKILESAKAQYGQNKLPAVRRVYGELAEVYSRQGDEVALEQLIVDFEASPAYDAEPYSTLGGWGPADPIVMHRPAAGAGAKGSTTVTAMKSKRALAQMAPGNPFPDFDLTDRDGNQVRLSDYQGGPVLIDFWVSKWHPWERRLPYLIDTYRSYHAQGFDVLGICLDRDTQGVDQYLAQKGVPWRQVVGQDSFPRQLGLYGVATSFLVDGQGQIIGRDLSAADLVEAIKGAL